MNTTAPSRRQAGFTLTELMIVVAIIAIIAAIGLPAYGNYARAAKRTDATGSLAQMAQLQERFFTENNTYAATTGALSYPTVAPNGANSARSKDDYWALSVVAATAGCAIAACYQIQAAPTNGHVDNDCAAITLDSTGLRGPPACWSGK